MAWIPRRSIAIGLTSFCYAAPFVWGAWPLYLLQVASSFMSDFVKTGRDSAWHPMDRTLAMINSFVTIHSAFWAIQWWEILCLVFLTYSNYAASVYCIGQRDFTKYEIFHSLWHLTGAASITYVAANGCGYQTSWGEDCSQRWVGLLYCNCLKGVMMH